MKKLFFLSVALFATGLAFSQNVSIGHSVPVAKLDISGTAANPSIPGILSTGILRVGVIPPIGLTSQEGIDIGKMEIAPWSGWIQSGFGGDFVDPLSLQPLGGNVGIGTGIAAPTAKLHVNGTLKVADGSQGEGKILTSDASGLASWQPPPPPPPSPAPTYYPSVTICCQSWMTKNLDVATYRNGDPIPQVTDPMTWAALTTGAWCYYNNDSASYAATYGKLYNWYAVNDQRGLSPVGWHIASDFEWTTLGTCLGGNAVAGGPMKEIGLTHWNDPNTGATNISAFTGLPGGMRGANGFISNGNVASWWTSTKSNSPNAWDRELFFNDEQLNRFLCDENYGLSVRCVRD